MTASITLATMKVAHTRATEGLSMSADTTTEDAEALAEKAGKKTGSGATANPGDKHLAENSKENLDEKLENAGEESFPGSDPVSVKITK